MKEDLKFTNVGYYYDEDTMTKTTKPLHEFQDLFLTKFTEMKGILGDSGEIKILLNPSVKPVKQHPYRLNLQYKEQVKVELDRMLDAGIIKHVEELEWINLMVIQDKKTG